MGKYSKAQRNTILWQSYLLVTCPITFLLHILSHQTMTLSSHPWYLQNKDFWLVHHWTRTKIHQDILCHWLHVPGLLFSNSAFCQGFVTPGSNEAAKKNMALCELNRFFGAVSIIKEPSQISQDAFEQSIKHWFLSLRQNQRSYV